MFYSSHKNKFIALSLEYYSKEITNEFVKTNSVQLLTFFYWWLVLFCWLLLLVCRIVALRKNNIKDNSNNFYYTKVSRSLALRRKVEELFFWFPLVIPTILHDYSVVFKRYFLLSFFAFFAFFTAVVCTF